MAIEISVTVAWVIAIILPILVVCLFVLIIPIMKKEKSSTIRRYLTYLVIPPQTHPDDTSWRTDKIRLFFFYIGFALFLITFMIGEFYQVMFDLTLPISQGSTGESRIASTVIFQSIFKAGWTGSLPWLGLTTYHGTWNWIFLTAAYTDNPIFLSTIIEFLTLMSIGVGLLFLAPLVIRRIRQSFLSAMFFFTAGMAVFSKAAISCLAYALVLAYSNAELEYAMLTATGSMIPGLSNVIIVMFPIVLIMFAFFVMLGRKLWRLHYADSNSRTWFTVYITLSFWLSLFLTVLVV